MCLCINFHSTPDQLQCIMSQMSSATCNGCVREREREREDYKEPPSSKKLSPQQPLLNFILSFPLSFTRRKYSYRLEWLSHPLSSCNTITKISSSLFQVQVTAVVSLLPLCSCFCVHWFTLQEGPSLFLSLSLATLSSTQCVCT